MPRILSVNIGVPREVRTKSGLTGIDKRPVEGPVAVAAPGPKGTGGSGLAGDAIVDREHHGGDDQAVYAFAREDLDEWHAELGTLRSGVFGENLTTLGLDVTGARLGERWQVGEDLVLEVTAPRIPCNTFATWMDERGWLKRFTERGRPGAYLRVVSPGEVRAGDPIAVRFRPAHEVTIALTFRALTTERDRLPELLGARDYLSAGLAKAVEEYRRSITT